MRAQDGSGFRQHCLRGSFFWRTASPCTSCMCWQACAATVLGFAWQTCTCLLRRQVLIGVDRSTRLGCPSLLVCGALAGMIDLWGMAGNGVAQTLQKSSSVQS